MPTCTAPAARTLRWTPNDDDFSPTAGALAVTVKGKTTTYVVQEFPTADIRRGFVLSKVGGDASGSTVLVDCRGARWDSCDCEGWKFKRKCRHAAAVRKLVDLGKL